MGKTDETINKRQHKVRRWLPQNRQKQRLVRLVLNPGVEVSNPGWAWDEGG